MTSVSPPSVFQPTLPARGATVLRAVHRARLAISTHAPRTGSDRREHWQPGNAAYFNPRSPHGERQGSTINRQTPEVISTHAPRTGSDEGYQKAGRDPADFNPRSPHGERHFRPSMRSRAFWYFNPRSPHGERPRYVPAQQGTDAFQPTLPARGATRRR